MMDVISDFSIKFAGLADGVVVFKAHGEFCVCSGRRGQDRINSHTLHINKPKSKIEVILDLCTCSSSKQSIAL